MTNLADGWEMSTVGDVANVQLGRQRSPQHHSGPSMRPYLRAANVTWRGVDLNDVKEMNFSPAEARTFALERGDILLNEASGSPNEVGKPVIWSGEIAGCCFQNTLLRVRSPHFAPTYLYWYFYSAALSGRFGWASRGVNIKHLGKNGLTRFPIPVPPLAEQERIIVAVEEHASDLDAADRGLARAARNLHRMRRAAVQDLFADQDWSWTTLGIIAELQGGVTKDAKRQDDLTFVETPYLRVANVQRGYLDLTDVATIRVPLVTARGLRLKPGDVLFNEGGDRDKLGRGWVWEGQVPDCIHQNHVFRARLLTEEFDPYFVSTHGNTWGQAWFEKHGKQTTNLASINLTTLKALPVPAPTRAEQKTVMAELDRISTDLDALEASARRQRQRSSALRRSVLAAAFSGRLVPQDPGDEPAAVLLERIRRDREAAPRGRRARGVE